MGNFDLKCDKSKAKAMKSLLRLYRRVLHNVNNRIFYLDVCYEPKTSDRPCGFVRGI